MESGAKFFERKVKGGEVVFFAGSGISLESGLPSAAEIMSETSKLFLPTDGQFIDSCGGNGDLVPELVRGVVRSIQPEVFYEKVLETSGSRQDVLSLWKILHPSAWAGHGVLIRGTPVHDVIVRYSSLNHVPIFTTNFDTLFEDSANRLGVDYRVIDPSSKPLISTSKRLAIVKLHGSISNAQGALSIKSLFTTMSEIAVTRYPLLEILKSQMMTKHLTLLGYSGRDLDIFPQLEEQTSRSSKEPIWVNDFTDKSGRLDETKEDCIKAKSLTDRVVFDSYPNRLFSSLELSTWLGIRDGQKAVNSRDLLESVKHLILEDLRTEVRAKVEWSEVEKNVLLGVLLGEIGKWEESFKILELVRQSNLSRRKLTELIALKYLCAATHNTSRIETMLKFATRLSRSRGRGRKSLPYRIVGEWYKTEYRRMSIPFDTFLFNDYLAELMFRKDFISAYHANTKAFLDLCKLIQEAGFGRGARVHNDSFAGFEYNGITVQQDLISLQLNNITIEAILLKDLYYLHDPELLRGIVTYLSRKVRSLEKMSGEVGYARGYRDCAKFISRIAAFLGEDVSRELDRGEFISSLLRDVTALGILARHRYETQMRRAGIDDSLIWNLTVLQRKDLESGNVLEALKSMLLIAECNRRAGECRSLDASLTGRISISTVTRRSEFQSPKGRGIPDKGVQYRRTSLYHEFRAIVERLEMPMWKEYITRLESEYPVLARRFQEGMGDEFSMPLDQKLEGVLD